jgi:hypothetical protein
MKCGSELTVNLYSFFIQTGLGGGWGWNWPLRTRGTRSSSTEWPQGMANTSHDANNCNAGSDDMGRACSTNGGEKECI